MDKRNYNSDQFQVANRVENMLPEDPAFVFQRHTTRNGSGLPIQHATGEGWERVSNPFIYTKANGEKETHPGYYQGTMIHPGSGRGGNEDANIAGDDLQASRRMRNNVIDNLLPVNDTLVNQTGVDKDNLRKSLYNSDLDIKDIEKVVPKGPMTVKVAKIDYGGHYNGNYNDRHIAINRNMVDNPPVTPSKVEEVKQNTGAETSRQRTSEYQRNFNGIMTHELGHAIDPFVESSLRNTDQFRERGQSKKSYPHPIHEGVAEGFTQQRGQPQTYSERSWKDPVNQALYIASLSHTYQQPRRYQGTGVDQSLEPTSAEDMVAKHVKNVQGPLDAKLASPLPEKKKAQREKGLLQYAQMKAPMHTLGRMWEELPHVRDTLRAHGLHDVAEDAAEHYKMFTRGVDPDQLELPL